MDPCTLYAGPERCKSVASVTNEEDVPQGPDQKDETKYPEDEYKAELYTMEKKLHTDYRSQIEHEIKEANKLPLCLMNYIYEFNKGPDDVYHDLVTNVDRQIEIGCDIIEPICNEGYLLYAERKAELGRMEEDAQHEAAINSILQCDCQRFDYCSCHGGEIHKYFQYYVYYWNVKTDIWETYWGINKKLELKSKSGQMLHYNNDDVIMDHYMLLIGDNNRCDTCEKLVDNKGRGCVCDDVKRDFKATYTIWNQRQHQ